MTENKIIFACKDHIEIALDDFVNTEEKAPQMKIVSNENSIKCDYCEKESVYEILL